MKWTKALKYTVKMLHYGSQSRVQKYKLLIQQKFKSTMWYTAEYSQFNTIWACARQAKQPTKKSPMKECKPCTRWLPTVNSRWRTKSSSFEMLLAYKRETLKETSSYQGSCYTWTISSLHDRYWQNLHWSMGGSYLIVRLSTPTSTAVQPSNQYQQ